MLILRVLNLLTWALVLAYMLPGAWSATTAKARYGDPMRLACALTAVVIIGFNLRALFMPEDELIWKALLLLSAALAGFILKLGFTYGRGAPLHREVAGDE